MWRFHPCMEVRCRSFGRGVWASFSSRASRGHRLCLHRDLVSFGKRSVGCLSTVLQGFLLERGVGRCGAELSRGVGLAMAGRLVVAVDSGIGRPGRRCRRGSAAPAASGSVRLPDSLLVACRGLDWRLVAAGHGAEWRNLRHLGPQGTRCETGLTGARRCSPLIQSTRRDRSRRGQRVLARSLGADSVARYVAEQVRCSLGTWIGMALEAGTRASSVPVASTPRAGAPLT